MTILHQTVASPRRSFQKVVNGTYPKPDYDLKKTSSAIANISRTGSVPTRLYTLSSLFSENSALPEGWERLRNMLFGITKEPGIYDATPDDISLAENELLKIHRVLFNEVDVLTAFFDSMFVTQQDPSVKNFVKPLEQYLDEEVAHCGNLNTTGRTPTWISTSEFWRCSSTCSLS